MFAQLNDVFDLSQSIIHGTAGDDTLHGGGGASTIYGAGGDDHIVDKGGDNLIFGGAGNDFIDAGRSNANVIDGGSGDDSIQGGNGGDVVQGGSGNDTVFGGAGDDTIEGGAGDDAMFGDNPFLIVVQHDTLSYEHAGGGITLDLAGLDPQDTGGAGVDTVFGFQDLIGSAFGDHLSGGDLGNIISAGFGDDVVLGQGGADQIDGGVGSDSLDGGGGGDTLQGGEGQDQLRGGGGKDLFVFSDAGDTLADHPDQILDLSNDDTIDLSHIDANLPKPGDQAFHLVGQFHGKAGEAVLSYDAGADVTHLQLDLDGDGQADDQIDLTGNHTDFVNFVL